MRFARFTVTCAAAALIAGCAAQQDGDTIITTSAKADRTEAGRTPPPPPPPPPMMMSGPAVGGTMTAPCPPPPPPPPPPAHEVALQRLAQLEAKELWQKGEIKAYQSELTYVLRAYLEDRFSLQALEATTAEICQDFKKHGLDEDGRMRTVMETADMVKFAKAMPPQNVHAEALDAVRHFVEETRAPEPSPTESTEENEAAV